MQANKNSELFIPKVMEYYKLDLPPFLIQSIWDTVNDAWFAKLDFENFNAEYMSNLGNEIMLSGFAFAKHRA